VKETINNWIKAQASRTGLFALGVAHTDGTFAGQSCSSIYPSIFLNNSWRNLRECFNTGRDQHQVTPVCLRLVFEHACLYAAQRSDGAVLGVYVSRDEQLVPRGQVEILLNEFLFLSEAAA